MTKKHLKRCSTLLIIREMQVKTTVRYCLALVRVALIKMSTNNNSGEGLKKREHFYTVTGNMNWYNHCGEQYGGSLRN